MKHKLLKSLIKDNNYTYSDIAKITRYPIYIKEVVNNKTELSYEMSVIISTIFKLTPDDIFYVKKLYTLLSYYKSNFKNTYACCSLITTISKTRVFPPINEYDIVGKEKCSDEIMNKIDKEIIDKFTKKFDRNKNIMYIITNKGHFVPFVNQRPSAVRRDSSLELSHFFSKKILYYQSIFIDYHLLYYARYKITGF